MVCVCLSLFVLVGNIMQHMTAEKEQVEVEKQRSRKAAKQEKHKTKKQGSRKESKKRTEAEKQKSKQAEKQRTSPPHSSTWPPHGPK